MSNQNARIFHRICPSPLKYIVFIKDEQDFFATMLAHGQMNRVNAI